MAIGLLALLATGLLLFVSKASTESQYSFLPQAQVLAPRAIEGTPPPTVCSYTVVETTGSIVPGTTDIGNHCDECITELQLPFPVMYYGQQFSQANVSSNGNLQFISANPISFNECLPGPSFEAAIMPHWDDLLTNDNPGCPGGGCGLFTSLSGSAPNRIFTIDWRAVLYRDPFQPVNFQVWFYEDQTRFDFVYGVVSENGNDYTWIRCLACRNIISGYTDGTFRPGNDITRGQIAKMVSNAAGYEDEIPPDRQTFEDVAPRPLFPAMDRATGFT
jgi:hypothetical protein